MKILIVEDEHKAGEYLQKGLIESGYVVDLVHDGGVDGLYHATSEEYDLILLDIMLPKLDGWQVLNTFRSSGIHTPVIMLTAKEQVEDRVRGFELGANDYVVKPYAFAELLARVQNVFRHHITAQVVASPQTLRVADLELDMIKRVATRAGQSMSLTAKEYALLELLMRKTGQVLSRTTIASLVWDMNFDSDTNVIDVAVKRLRNKVDKPFDKPLIHTVRGMGYKLEESRDA
ncbi:DNA-binding heavy metal response regulator [Vibrio sp. JCM 18905]|nr:DNA-binding heavy metal response regulator [Vibrio sp. JCM 18905]